MSFTVQSIYNSQVNYFSGRAINPASCYENTRKVVLELTENYDTPLLKVSGPVVTLTAGQNGYPYNTFLQPADYGLEINETDSFFLYYQGQYVPGAPVNAGYPLKFKSINDLEILLNIQGPPTNWTRNEQGQIYLAMCPDQIYYVYLRYQKEHPFPNAGTANAGQDPILMANSWQDIVEIATAERNASDLNMEDRRVKFFNRLHGDPKAARGTPGYLGLLFSRTSQTERDQETTTRSMRLMMRPYGR